MKPGQEPENVFIELFLNELFKDKEKEDDTN